MNQGLGYKSLGLVLLLFLASGVVAALIQQGSEPAKGRGDQTEVAVLRARIESLERRLEQQANQASEEKLLMIKVLDASTRRLDELCRAIDAGAPIHKPAPKTAGGTAVDSVLTKTDGPSSGAAGAAADRPAESMFGELTVLQMLGIVLAVSVLLLVIGLVFFPGRLRGSVPQIEYNAEPDPVGAPSVGKPAPADSESAEGPDSVSTATDSKGPAIVPVARSFPDPVLGDGNPVPHKLSIGLGDQTSVESLVTVLDSYLNTEPYILRQPAPRVAVGKGELHLKFYALPTLSKTEHALLDATVRRLQPASSQGRETRPTWGRGSQPDSSGDAADSSIA